MCLGGRCSKTESSTAALSICNWLRRAIRRIWKRICRWQRRIRGQRGLRRRAGSVCRPWRWCARKMPVRILSVFAGAVLMSGVAMRAQVPAGNLSCATCHAAQAQHQPETSMARAVQLPAADPLFKKHPKLTFTLGQYTYSIERRGGEVTYSVADGRDAITLPMHYAFGVGSQTFVLEREGRLYESFVSYYPAIDGLDVTMGDQSIQPTTVME